MILDLPTVKKPYSSSFVPVSTSAMVENTFNAAVQVSEGDEYWDGEVEYRNTDQSQTQAFRTFFLKLKGTAGEFWFVDYAHVQRGVWGGTPVVDGNYQDGTLLAVRDLPANLTVGLVGDRFQLGDYMHELVEDVTTDATGRAEFSFLPGIRKIPTDGQTVNVVAPRCKCMLYPDQKIPAATTKKALLSAFKFKFRESLR